MTLSPVKTPGTEGKKDVQKLQRAIIDGLEDVKAQDIQVFDTEHITSLFERVIVASGTSNRQTKALAASVRDAVRNAGFTKPRIEGEDNGEWIIVDCGAVVAHIMQPTIRQYYNLEELWGDKPVKLKLGAPAPAVKAAAKKVSALKTAQGAAVPAAKKATRTDDGTYAGRVGKTHDWTATRNATVPAGEPAARSPARAAKKTAVKRATAKSPAVKKAVAKSPIVKIAAAKKVSARKDVARPAARKATAKKATGKTKTRSE